MLDGLFLATILTVTFHKLQWELAGSLTLSDVLTSVFLVLFAWDRFERGDAKLTRSAIVGLAFFAAFAVVYLLGFYNLDTGQALAQWAKGMVKFVLHFGFLVAGVALIARRGVRFYWYALAAFCGGIALNAGYGVVQLALAEVAGTNLDEILIEPITSRQTGINVFGAVGGTQEVFRPNALTGDPNHLGIELLVPLLILTPLYLRLETRAPAADAARGPARLPARRRARNPLPERPARPGLRRARAGDPVPAPSAAARVPAPARRGRAGRGGRRGRPARLLPDRTAREDEHEPRRGVTPLRGVLVRPGRPLVESVARARAQQLRRLLRVRHRAGPTSGPTPSTSPRSSRRDSSEPFSSRSSSSGCSRGSLRHDDWGGRSRPRETRSPPAFVPSRGG